MVNKPVIVTIITPTFNHAGFIAECIQSALSQTFTDWEMLIINDGSTDQTAEIAARYAAADPRITLFNQQNIGIFRLAESYNLALQHAKGKYITILEGDDIWETDKLSRQVAALESNPLAVMAWSSARQVNIDQSQVFEVSPELKPEDIKLFTNNPVGSFLDILLFRNCIPALTACIRKEALEKIGGFQQGYGLPLVDLPTWQLLSTLGAFVYDPEPTGRWRVYPGQTTKTHLVKIFSGFYALSLDNFRKFSSDPSLSFSVKQKAIKIHFDKVMIMAYAREGRYLLIKKQYKEARKRYIKAIFSKGGEYVWKLRALVGLFLSLFHLDVEGLAKFLNRPSYKN
jgi:glycosyltransferase involved in cell wall biosynthesis